MSEQSQETPQSLLAAYTAATGLPVSLSYERQRVLSEAVTRGLSAADITAVCKELKRLVDNGTKGYGPSSLDFRNAIGNLDTLEERCIRLRQRRDRTRRSLAQKPVPQTRVVGPGESVSVIAEKLPDSDVARLDAAKALRALAKDVESREKEGSQDGV